ncbi:MAG: GIY-YIG nuclease family protein [Planctomycetota bacterium]
MTNDVSELESSTMFDGTPQVQINRVVDISVTFCQTDSVSLIVRNDSLAGLNVRYASLAPAGCFWLVLFCLAAIPALANPSALDDNAIRTAFSSVHQGYSTDEVLIRHDLRVAFLDHLGINSEERNHDEYQRTALSQLLRLRKTGQLNVATTQRSLTPALTDTSLAELSIRSILDRHQTSIDEVLCDPQLRRELWTEARLLAPDVDADSLHKSILQLRKRRRLRPELVLRVADWDRKVETWTISDLRNKPLPNNPGIYVFRDASGYLYVGEAANLSVRLEQHLSNSHNKSLAKKLSSASPEGKELTVELHIFPHDCPAKKVAVRRAYESELIRSRHPLFNLQP